MVAETRHVLGQLCLLLAGIILFIIIITIDLSQRLGRKGRRLMCQLCNITPTAADDDPDYEAVITLEDMVNSIELDEELMSWNGQK